MRNLTTPEQIQGGCPITFSMEIRVPQNGQQTVEATPVLAKYAVTYGGVTPDQFISAAQHAAEQLSALAEEEISSQFGFSLQGQQGRQQRWGQRGQGQPGSTWGAERARTAVGS
jgi:hypothetical protein